MFKKHLIPVILISILLQSCHYELDNETTVFDNYLENNYKERIPANDHTYLLICRLSCYGCVLKALAQISAKVKNDRSKEITVLTYDISIVPEPLNGRVTMLLDTDCLYENIGLPIANLALIKSNRGEITKIRILNFDEIDIIVNEEF